MILLLVGLLAFLALRTGGRLPPANRPPADESRTPPERPVSDRNRNPSTTQGDEAKTGEPKMPTFSESVVLGEEKRLWLGDSGSFWLKVYADEIRGKSPVGDGRFDVRYQPQDALPVLFSITFRPSDEVEPLRLPLDTDWWNAVTVRVLRQEREKTFLPLPDQAYRVSVVKRYH